MAKGPAVVVVARHGARLDAADKSWHLTSPAPYDPPLTYGGWSQAKALGQRVAALLHQRDEEQAVATRNGANGDPAQLHLSKLDISSEGTAQPEGLQRRKKRRRVIIHSSPFLRCVQTSTAIAAGISQCQPSTTPILDTPTPSTEKSSLLGSPASTPSRARSPAAQPRSFQPVADPSSHIAPKPHHGPERILLRIDAFLGEWLSPDYYEDITSPPNSTMMVAGAKADLLRRGDYIQEQSNPDSSKGHFPGGWVRKDAAAASPTMSATGAVPTLGSLAQAAPFRERASSYNGFPSLQRSRSREAVPAHSSIPSRVYEPPQPSYSVSPSDLIPRGYVAHAQDACVKVDFQWDSMRPPQNWGDGGEYGDEWSTMHKRFRKGLAGMMEWYRLHGAEVPKESFPGFLFKEPLRLTPPVSQAKPEPFPLLDDETAAEEDEELVVVIVTHGAGCNALLGAIQNQPVLMDIGLASLSMAVRRDEPIKPPAPTIHDRRLSVADPGMSDTYEMKLLASVDHLRPGVDPSKLPSTQSRMQSPIVTGSPSLDYRRRFTGSFTSNSPLESPFSLGEPHRTLSSSLSGVRRTMSSGSNSRFTRHSTSGVASPAGGLWSGTQTPASESSSADMVLNFATQHPSPKPLPPSTASIPIPESALETTNNGLTKLDSKEEKEVGDKFTPLVSAQSRTKSGSSAGLWGAKVAQKTSNGLWGPPKLDDVYEHSHGPKRRWTVTERGDAM